MRVGDCGWFKLNAGDFVGWNFIAGVCGWCNFNVDDCGWFTLNAGDKRLLVCHNFTAGVCG